VANLDEHADWVNQIILDAERQLCKHKNYQFGIVISCSNDTTIKIWSLQGIDPQKGQVQTVRALSTLNEDFDYVRAIAYSPVKSVLYSAADNGIVR
jgi:WD40 repeat protein